MEEREIEIDLRDLFMGLLSNIWSIILSACIGALCAFLLCAMVIPKKYVSTTKIYAINKQSEAALTYTDLQTGSQLSKDYAALVTSRTVTSKVIAQLDLQNTYEDMKNITPDGLARMISVDVQTDTRIIAISVTDTNPTRAQDIANAVRVAASEHIYNVMDIEAVNIVDYANLPEGAKSPNTKKSIVIGFMLGFILASGIVILIRVMDDTIKTSDDVERFLGLSVLGQIPYDDNVDTAKKKHKKKK